ncbi:hypothetical protein BDY19DRAFT_940929 [Irpex rosettiformis]|uniref:Uncharacterized protein n=1 Tax=Irpex rosettiformis TaxID=378272 RepID=A0ACB8U6B5_9APHY|nr:hypothetical protein BDY19DRAFT_940929 [Irpex rosettiformis]
MLGIRRRRCYSDHKPTPPKGHAGPLLDFGRLNEVSSAHTPIQFGCVAVPTEVFYEIIDNLSADKHTLAHLSLVCKSWYYGTRPHLFREVSIRETGSTYLWYPFTRTLRTTPEVCSLVRELHISMEMNSIQHAKNMGGSDKNEYNLYVLANVVKKLSSLKVLTFTDAEWHVDDPDTAPVPKIYHLGLRTLVFKKRHCSRSLYDIVSWFPGLKVLCVEREYGGKADGETMQSLCKGLRLETLELNAEPMTYDRLLEEIARTESVKTIRSFTYHVWQVSLPVLCGFLALAGSQLHTLRLSFKDDRLLEEWKRHGDFGVPEVNNCISLDTVTLSFPLKTSRIWGNHLTAVTHCIEHLFESLSADKLSTIIFHFDVPYADKQFENLQLECLHRFLSQLVHLQHIIIITRRSSMFKAYRDISHSLEPFQHMLRVRASDGPGELPKSCTHPVEQDRREVPGLLSPGNTSGHTSVPTLGNRAAFLLGQTFFPAQMNWSESESGSDAPSEE